MVKLCYSKGWRPIVLLRDFPFRQQFCQCCICRAVHCRHPGLGLPCPYVLALGIGRNRASQASAPCSYAVLFLLMPTALQQLGKQDFALLLSLEQKLTSARDRNLERLNHNPEIQRAGLRSGTAGITQQPYFQEIRINPMSFKPHRISSLLPSAPAPALRFPNLHVLPQFSAFPSGCLSNNLMVSFFSQPRQCKERVFRFRINLPNSTLPKGLHRH